VTEVGAPITASELITDPAGVPRARAMLQRAEWAARAFARYDKGPVDAIVRAAAQAGAAKAREYAEWAVRETGFGVVEHKVLKNVACSTGIAEHYAGQDYVTPRLDPEAKIVEIPRPAGVVLALTPSTNPVATVFFKVLLALMTRNVVVLSPHPLAKECCADAARTMAAAAVAAGAPDGVIQVVDEPSVPLIDALMTDARTSVIVATGGVPVVRAAYSSGNPAIGVGPGNVPVLVDATADLPKAAVRIVDSKSFDNSILCTNESVLIVQEQVADALIRQLRRAGAYLLEPAERDKVSALLFPGGRFDIRFVGKDATWIAAQAGVKVPATTRVLLAPFDLVVPEEPLAHEKLCPVLGLVRVPSARRGIDAARAVLRLSGRGHSAAIHSRDPRVIMEYGAAVEVLRVAVNAGNSLGSAGLETGLAPSMTIGTGFFGRSSMAENLHPSHLVQWTRLAYNSDRAEPFGDFTGLIPWQAPAGPVPPYPVASNQRDGNQRDGNQRDGNQRDGQPRAGADGRGAATIARSARIAFQPEAAALREEIRRLIIEELSQLVGR
jgi:acetaldehyde dehydrogenase/alcohol dehydrogenase